MATDNFTGGATTLAAHDSNWQLADTASLESLADIGIDGSGFAKLTAAFKSPVAMYSGTDSSQKSEIVIPIGAFATVVGAESVAVVICASTGNVGFEGRIGAAQLTGQVVNAIRMASNNAFIISVTLSPTIDTAATALTMSLRRTSTTNVDLIVNGTPYSVNTTGVDITTGQGGFFLLSGASLGTTKIDSWTNGVAGGAVSFMHMALLGV